jgi:hypothetical protein
MQTAMIGWNHYTRSMHAYFLRGNILPEFASYGTTFVGITAWSIAELTCQCASSVLMPQHYKMILILFLFWRSLIFQRRWFFIMSFDLPNVFPFTCCINCKIILRIDLHGLVLCTSFRHAKQQHSNLLSVSCHSTQLWLLHTMGAYNTF